MRIGLFTDTYPPFINGVSTSVYMLKKALEKEGHTVFVVTMNDKSLHYDFDENDTVVRVPGLQIGLYDYRVTTVYPLRALNIIRKWKLDVIHSHTEFSVGTFARVLARQFNIPLVHTYHTMYEDYIYYITGGYFDRTSKKLLEYLTKFYCDKTANELIVPTKKTYDLFKEKYEVNKNIHIIPTGIEIERFYEENIDKNVLKSIRRKLNLKKDDFTILYVGRIAEEKNIDFLLDSMKDLISKNNNINLLIVGDGPDLERYEEKSKKLKIDSNTIFLGKIPWEEVTYYYNIATVFATASKSETQGLTVIEAMASGTPPICIEDESFQNTVIDNLNGRIFKTKKEYTEIIGELYNDKEKLKRLKRQARINAETHSSKYYAESVLDVYKTAINNRNHNNLGVVGRIFDKVKEEKDEISSRKSKSIFK